MRLGALEVNKRFDEFLDSLRLKPEVAKLYLAMMEATFKSKEGDQEQHLAKLKNQSTSHEVIYLNLVNNDF